MDPWFLEQHVGHCAEAAESGVRWGLARNRPQGPPPTPSLGILWLPAAKPPLIGIDIRRMAVGPARADPAGGLGQADPNPHAGVCHKGARAPRPGTCVSPVLLKRHIADALAKASEDVGDLQSHMWPFAPGPSLSILSPSSVHVVAGIRTLCLFTAASQDWFSL